METSETAQIMLTNTMVSDKSQPGRVVLSSMLKKGLFTEQHKHWMEKFRA